MCWNSQVGLKTRLFCCLNLNVKVWFCSLKNEFKNSIYFMSDWNIINIKNIFGPFYPSHYYYYFRLLLSSHFPLSLSKKSTLPLSTSLPWKTMTSSEITTSTSSPPSLLRHLPPPLIRQLPNEGNAVTSQFQWSLNLQWHVQ